MSRSVFGGFAHAVKHSIGMSPRQIEAGEIWVAMTER